MSSPEITIVDRGRMATDANLILDGAWRATRSDPDPEPVYGEGPIINAIIETDEMTLLWDTGAAADAEERWSESMLDMFAPVELRPLADDLDAAGYDLADVDAVIASHLHIDHAGGLGAFGPDVPIYVHHDEFGYAHERARMPDSVYVSSDFDGDHDWRLVQGRRRQVTPNVELLHLPGHTPGLMGVLVTGRDQPVLLTGDLAYVGANYEGQPMSSTLLWSRHQWEQSLAWCTDVERRHDARVVYGHDRRLLAALPTTL